MKKEKKKFKAIIMSYVLAFVCVTSWVALGVVLALTSANISVNGKISFTANDVYADVTGTVTGTATTNTLEAIHLTADTTSFTTPSSWSDIAFDFVEGKGIVFTINISNKSAERPILIKFTDNISATNTDIKRQLSGITVSSFSTFEVPKSTTKSVKIALHLIDSNQSASGTFNLGLELISLPPTKDASEYPTLSFSANNTSKTATVRANYSNMPTGNLVIPGSVIIDGQEYAVTGFEDANAFNGCSGLTSVIIPANITIIGSHAFTGCSSLTSIIIPYTAEAIADYAFAGCSALTSVTIPAWVTGIGSGAFAGCSALTSITIPEGVTDIGSGAFAECSKLTSATFEETTLWKAGDTVLNSSDLADKATAATYLTSTYVDQDFSWGE